MKIEFYDKETNEVVSKYKSNLVYPDFDIWNNYYFIMEDKVYLKQYHRMCASVKECKNIGWRFIF